MADRYTLMKHLPAYSDKWEKITGKQDVYDIINEILNAHQEFARQYDKIALYFDGKTVQQICSQLYSFCKNNIRYKQETEAKQTTKSPSAILAHGYGDCKHYASFCGGILDALNRMGANIKWHYRFASYNPFNTSPEHVFIVVDDNKKEIWIDPTPGADKVKPVWQINKRIKVNSMPLYRVSGIGAAEYNYPVSDLLQNVSDTDIENAVQLLLRYGIMDAYAKVNDKFLFENEGNFDPQTYAALIQAFNTVQAAAIGGFFANIWHGVKNVVLSPARNAYLALVGLNAFGYATKLSAALFNKDGSFTDFQHTLYKKWNKLGGKWDKLVKTIRDGARKRAILGAPPVAAAATIPAWVTIASACIAAIMPLVKIALENKRRQTGIDFNNLDPNTGMPYGTPGPEQNPGAYNTGESGWNAIEFLEKNPLLVAGAAVAVVYLLKKK